MKNVLMVLVLVLAASCGKKSSKQETAPTGNQNPPAASAPETSTPDSTRDGQASVSRGEFIASFKAQCVEQLGGSENPKVDEFCGCNATAIVDLYAKKCGVDGDMVKMCEVSEEETSASAAHCDAILQ